MKKLLLYLTLTIFFGHGAYAQRACLSKLSPMLRHYVLEEREKEKQTVNLAKIHDVKAKKTITGIPSPMTTAFIKVSGDGEKVLRQHGGKVWARYGNIYIATIPLNSVSRLSSLPEIQRIEANMNPKCTLDSVIIQTNALPVYEGRNLTQVYTGKGVVMGIMDIGFDFTNPNFYNPQMTDYRIKAFWDQISSDTLQSTLPVGREYIGKEHLLALGCSRDGYDNSHGTHTLGIAAGSGCEGVASDIPGKYHGMAYESDICLVANATSENAALIDSSQTYKFTYAMDALGFKYIFDYADQVGKPCVISFSEGAGQDFDGTDLLYGEILDSLTRIPGHVLVSSAGNNGQQYYYMHKPMEKESAGCFVNSAKPYVYHIAKSSQPFTLRTTIYEERTHPHIFDVNTEKILATADSTLIDTVEVAGKRYVMMMGAYPSCYQKEEICYDWMVKALDEKNVGLTNYMAYQVMGKDADVQVYHGSGNMYICSVDPSLADCEKSHSINSPSSYPSVICVGATINHTGYTDIEGKYKQSETLSIGALGAYSSIGPTFDERIKPDVIAPGSTVISSYNSFYEVCHPDNWDRDTRISSYTYQGRNYFWHSNSGTSMASPVVGGAIALWLEANPSLNSQDVLDIIKKTSIPLDKEQDIPNNLWGYGKLDVYRGLLAALNLDGIPDISTYLPQKAQIGMDRNKICINLTEKATQDFRVSVYNLSGIRMKVEKMQSGEMEYLCDISELPTGIYIIQLSGYQAIQGSSLIRKK